MHSAVCAAAGVGPQGSGAIHVWTLIHKMPEGDWAGGGNIVYYQQVNLSAQD